MFKYIALIILKPNKKDKKNDIAQANICNLFEQNSKVQKIWYIGKKELDHKIQNYNEGIYLKLEILSNYKKIAEIQKILKLNDNILFSTIMKNENNKQNNLPKPFKTAYIPYLFNSKKVVINKSIKPKNDSKIYMLISKNVNLPCAESDIIAMSDDKNKLLQEADKKIAEFIYVKGFYTVRDFTSIKRVQKDFRQTWKTEFSSFNNSNVTHQLLLKEQCLI